MKERKRVPFMKHRVLLLLLGGAENDLFMNYEREKKGAFFMKCRVLLLPQGGAKNDLFNLRCDPSFSISSFLLNCRSTFWEILVYSAQ